VDLLNTLLRGYQTSGFENWTIICLYTVCKILRIFAMKADEERNSKNILDDSAAANFQDDFDPETNKRQKLEDCVRQLFKAFKDCQSDRYACPFWSPKHFNSPGSGHRSRSLASGEATTSPTYFSSHTSS
jgi:hypothetical protein